MPAFLLPFLGIFKRNQGHTGQRLSVFIGAIGVGPQNSVSGWNLNLPWMVADNQNSVLLQSFGTFSSTWVRYDTT
jgi:hypothetical protein